MKKPSKNPATPISPPKPSTAVSEAPKQKRGAMDEFGARIVENLNRNVRDNEPTN